MQQTQRTNNEASTTIFQSEYLGWTIDIQWNFFSVHPFSNGAPDTFHCFWRILNCPLVLARSPQWNGPFESIYSLEKHVVEHIMESRFDYYNNIEQRFKQQRNRVIRLEQAVYELRGKIASQHETDLGGDFLYGSTKDPD